MAVSKASTDSGSGMLYALVVFVILFLASAVFAVWMFVSNSGLDKGRDRAITELEKFGNDAELREVRPLIQMNKTVLGQLSADMKYLCGLVAGADLQNFSLVGAKVNMDKRLGPIWEKLPTALSNPQEADPAAGLANIVESLIKERDAWAERYMQADADKENLKQLYDQKIAASDQLNAQSTLDLGKESKAALTYEEIYKQRFSEQTKGYEAMLSTYESEKTKLNTENDLLTKRMAQVQLNLDKCESKLLELEEIVRLIRPSPEMETAALKSDGAVVSVNARDKLAYIDLAKNDHIYRGLTFTVYDSYQSIPKSGEGKATLEVIEIMDSISKCRITQYDPTNPIMKGDVIANLIWDKDKKYQFCVAGEFDFNGDGKIDSDGKEQIANLITAWGGQVTKAVSVDTDFLVLGKETETSVRPPEEDMERNTPAAVAYMTAQASSQLYAEVRQNGAALGVPTFNTSRFFHFIGYHPEESGN